MKIHHYTASELKAIRKQVGLNQAEFWGKFGITQSGGSRYESGRDVPKPVQLLLNIALAKCDAAGKAIQRIRLAPTRIVLEADSGFAAHMDLALNHPISQ